MSNIVELRQYTLKPGQRDALIALFEREFVESQEAAGIALIGTFRDLDDPDRFVWLRGFADMDARAKSLAAFYGSPVWKANREAANATMIDSDNVLLLHPAWSGSGFAPGGVRAPPGATASPPGLVSVAICHFDSPVPDAFVAAFRSIVPHLEAGGAKNAATFVTERSVNTFPVLPVRADANVLVWVSLFANQTHPTPLPPELQRLLARPPEVLRLMPTARSRLHA